MIELYPAGHLLVGYVEGSATASSRVLGRLLKGMGPKGDYAFTP
jgi:hypothetical protein